MSTQKLIQGIGLAVGVAAAAWVGTITFNSCTAPVSQAVVCDGGVCPQVDGSVSNGDGGPIVSDVDASVGD